MKKRIVALFIIVVSLVFIALGSFYLPRRSDQAIGEREKFEQNGKRQSDMDAQKTADISEDVRVSEYLRRKLILEPQQAWESSKSFQEVGEELVDSYEKRGDSIPVFSGYLDVLGKTWSCVFQGNGWIDICLVSDEGSNRKVAVCHVTTQEVKEIASQE